MVTLAEIRAGTAPQNLPTADVPLCMDSAMWAELDALTAELSELSAEGAAPKRAPKASDGPNPRVAELEERRRELWTAMEAGSGVLVLTSRGLGDWIRWIDAHPPRQDNLLDDELALGLCNAVDLVDDLGRWATSWDGDPFQDGDWALFAPRVPAGASKRLVQAVVMMHDLDILPKGLASQTIRGAPVG